MNEPRQRQFLALGEAGCYVFTVIHIAEEETGTYIDAYQTYLWAVLAKMIAEDCYINDPAAFLSRLTGVKWTVEKQPLEYVLKSGEHEVTRYDETVSPTITKTHFVETDGRGNVIFDPMGAGSLSPLWKPASKRIFRRT